VNTKLRSIGLAAFGAAALTIVGVEDSATGVKAAVAAQIRVIGFAADDINTPALANAGAKSIISDYNMLITLF
jgi:beta-phosphoglucomutase-like phosphatase (HAD superfamily)